MKSGLLGGLPLRQLAVSRGPPRTHFLLASGWNIGLSVLSRFSTFRYSRAKVWGGKKGEGRHGQADGNGGEGSVRAGRYLDGDGLIPIASAGGRGGASKAGARRDRCHRREDAAA